MVRFENCESISGLGGLILNLTFFCPSRDIVDTEPFQGGNLLKMLLGATFPWFDGDDDDEEDV